jgi:hypothetical protein
MTTTSTIKLLRSSLLRATCAVLLFTFSFQASATKLLIPMDESQQDHLKAYGIAYWTLLQQDVPVEWLLNYRGGSFLIDHFLTVEQECTIRGVTYQVIADGQAAAILSEIGDPEANMEVVKLEKAPKIAVYAPESFQPWDDAVALVMTYAEIPYERIYDQQVIAGTLPQYDWLHLHHEDFTGQYGKFYRSTTVRHGTWPKCRRARPWQRNWVSRR